MTCVICKVELVEERKEVEGIVESTGYHYCPSCGLVYKKEKP